MTEEVYKQECAELTYYGVEPEEDYEITYGSRKKRRRTHSESEEDSNEFI